ncbi:hypothetical protein [Sphingobacterium lactis]|uniref:hypothetical protein n=1 Tax=Sphingobacterium lactis TaxID=797291 RepID=UPI003DA513F3
MKVIMKQTKSKKTYIAPMLTVAHIEMEESIAAGSINIETGGTENEPLMEDWYDTPDNHYKDFEI